MEVSERRSQKSQPRGRKRVLRTGGRYCGPGCHRWVEVPEGRSPEKGRTSRGRSTGAGNCHGRRRRVIVATLSVQSESGEHECWGVIWLRARWSLGLLCGRGCVCWRWCLAEWQVAEAAALVRALPGWSVARTLVVPSAAPGSRLVFGKGNFRDLTEKIRGCQDITSVFLNVEKMAPPTKKELETAWGLRVFDRFTLVLHIFRCNARTREARMQLALAEIPLLRSSVSGDYAQDHQGWGSRYIMGSGESPTELRARALRDRELRLRRALERLRDKRRLMRRERVRREFPVVSVVGYTNCGKTTLIQALTGEAAMQPRDQPFATLDVTVHAGLLPSRLRILYVDTIGFLSQLPHSLIHAFSATLEDVAYSDVLVHVTDVSHPDAELQKATVLSTLRGLHLPPALLESALEVHSKVDLVPGYTPPCSGALAVSAVSGRGLDELKAALEASVLSATGRQVVTLCVRLGGPQLGWLYKEAMVQQVQELPEGGAAHVTVVITQAAYGRFRKLFPADASSVLPH